jgi:rhomboid protease GluP
LKIARSIPLHHLTTREAYAIAFETALRLNQAIHFDENDSTMIPQTARDRDDFTIHVRIGMDELIVETGTETDDELQGEKQSQGLQLFVGTFETLRLSATAEDLARWMEKAKPGQPANGDEPQPEAATEEIAAFEKAQVPSITYALIAINVVVFLIMAISGVSLVSPTGPDIINWGGNYGPFTKNGDWWRLISCMFVHVGIVHLLFNMYALLTVGVFLEPILGKTRYLIAYFSTGVVASVVSTWWNNESIVSAGASGAVFGMYGLFLALLSSNLIPKQIRKQLLQGIAIFVGYNLLNGLKSGIDNAAHIGGLISGLVAGYLFYLAMRKEQVSGRSPYPALLILGMTTLGTYLFLQQNAPVIVKDDSEKFSRTMEHFGALEELALEAMNPADTVSPELYLKELKKTALTDWVECVNLFEEAEKFVLSPRLKTLRRDMLQYSNQRVQQTLLTIKAVEEKTDRYKTSLDSLDAEIQSIIEKVQEGSSPTQDL